MKHFIKMAFYLLSIIYIFGISSCEKDLYEDKIKQEKYLVKKISFKDINCKYLNPTIINLKTELKTKNLNAKNAALGKMVYDSINNFYFDDENVLYAEKDLEHSYTFKISRPQNDGKLENLVLSKKGDGTYGIYFVKYSFKEEDYKYLTQEEIENSQKNIKEIVENENGESIILQKCVHVEIEAITSPRDDGMIGPNTIYFYIFSPCTSGDESDSSNSDSNGTNGNPGAGTENGNTGTSNSGSTSENNNTNNNGSNTGPNSNGGGSSTTPIMTSPIICTDCINDEPCEKLQNLIDDAEFIEELNYLKTKVNLFYEYGIRMERKREPIEGELYNKYTRLSGGEFNVTVSLDDYTYGNAHNHTFSSQSIPSWGDLQWLHDCEDYTLKPRNEGFAINVIVVKNSQNPTQEPIVYAIKINDYNKLKIKIAADRATVSDEYSEQNKLDALNEKFGKKFNSANGSTSELEIKFLKVYTNYGVDLYKLDETLNKWNKLGLQNPYNPNNENAVNSIVPTPCN